MATEAGPRIGYDRYAPVGGAFGDKWVSWQREIAILSAKGSFSFIGIRSHIIHLRHAAAVTAAVGEIASPAGTNSGLSLDEG